MDQATRLRRREEARRRTYRQRRLALAAVVGLVVLALAVPLVFGGDDASESTASEGAADTAAPPELPRGGREILPRYRVVGFYGAPQDDELGELGIGTPDETAVPVDKTARP